VAGSPMDRGALINDKATLMVSDPLLVSLVVLPC